MLFGNDNEGRMTFGDDTYLYSTSGISEQGLRRAEEKAHWMNAHLLAEITKARQAALEEAAQIAVSFRDPLQTNWWEVSERDRALIIAKQIRALISVAGNHASQQPHATDAESTRG